MLKKLVIYVTFFIATGVANVSFANSTATALPIPGSEYTAPPQGEDLIGNIVKIKTQQVASLQTLAQQYDLGAIEIDDANPNRTRELFNPGNTVVLPKQFILPPPSYRSGIVVNISELRLYYFTPNGEVMTFPVALGREGWRTPLVKTHVVRKQAGPTWYVPASIRLATLAKTGEQLPEMVPPGPDNPLGDYALYLATNGYLIHGTNNPSSIGQLVSSGCIRLYNTDVAQLFNWVVPGTSVRIINYPDKAGWQGNSLYLEAHQPVQDVDGYYNNATPNVQAVIAQAIANRPANIDWKKVNLVLKKHTGIPTIIGEAVEPVPVTSIN